MVLAELLGCPGGDRVGDRFALSPAVLEEFAVGVAADPHDAVAEAGQQVEDLGGLRAGGDVAGQHDAIGGAEVWFGEYCFQGRQDSVDVGQNGYTAQHAHHCRPEAAAGCDLSPRA
ncbi:hypothetical protein VR44_11605 [Streptomyces katrae]|uniref:Uncharacterized protein n=1 Tax=Streptomyces katrae TaxID=68223 RepID=A0A0F4JJU7_9ACTN|nr:hypothetical protein VR44_11605 [Streptomyces katrae]